MPHARTERIAFPRSPLNFLRCDGPPYAYHWGLIKAQKHLEELDAPLPDMPPFDESKYEPMPDVEIDPDDEFHIGNDTETRPEGSV